MPNAIIKPASTATSVPPAITPYVTHNPLIDPVPEILNPESAAMCFPLVQPNLNSLIIINEASPGQVKLKEKLVSTIKALRAQDHLTGTYLNATLLFSDIRFHIVPAEGSDNSGLSNMAMYYPSLKTVVIPETIRDVNLMLVLMHEYFGHAFWHGVQRYVFRDNPQSVQPFSLNNSTMIAEYKAVVKNDFAHIKQIKDKMRRLDQYQKNGQKTPSNLTEFEQEIIAFRKALGKYKALYPFPIYIDPKTPGNPGNRAEFTSGTRVLSSFVYREWRTDNRGQIIQRIEYEDRAKGAIELASCMEELLEDYTAENRLLEEFDPNVLERFPTPAIKYLFPNLYQYRLNLQTILFKNIGFFPGFFLPYRMSQPLSFFEIDMLATEVGILSPGIVSEAMKKNGEKFLLRINAYMNLIISKNRDPSALLDFFNAVETKYPQFKDTIALYKARAHKLIIQYNERNPATRAICYFNGESEKQQKALCHNYLKVLKANTPTTFDDDVSILETMVARKDFPHYKLARQRILAKYNGILENLLRRNASGTEIGYVDWCIREIERRFPEKRLS